MAEKAPDLVSIDASVSEAERTALRLKVGMEVAQVLQFQRDQGEGQTWYTVAEGVRGTVVGYGGSKQDHNGRLIPEGMVNILPPDKELGPGEYNSGPRMYPGNEVFEAKVKGQAELARRIVLEVDEAEAAPWIDLEAEQTARLATEAAYETADGSEAALPPDGEPDEYDEFSALPVLENAS